MKTLHVHIKVDDLQKNIEFYNTLFATQASVIKEDYAKWMLEDPKVNFAISLGKKAGLEHLGIQVEDTQELNAVYKQLENAKTAVREEGKTVCCYAQSEKSWVADPQGIEWEVFHTFGESTTYGKVETTCC